MLDNVKAAIRISGNDSDVEILDLINAAKLDLQLSGVHIDKINDTDPLIKRAVILYCKASFGYDDMSVRFQESYISLKQHLTLSQEYIEVV